MKKYAKLKYPQRYGNNLLPTGTIVEVLSKDDPMVLKVFPRMKERPESIQVAILYPGAIAPTIAHVDQIILIDEDKTND